MINAVFAEKVVQARIVHLMRNAMGFASRKDRKAIGVVGNGLSC